MRGNVVYHYKYFENSKTVVINTNSNRNDGEFALRMFLEAKKVLMETGFRLRFHDFHIHADSFSETKFSISFDGSKNQIPEAFRSNQLFNMPLVADYKKTLHN